MSSQPRKTNPLAQFRGLSFNQKITILITGVSALTATASCFISIIALKISADSRDVKDAIRNLSELAIQTKRQADNSAAQLDALKIQADAAKSQTDAISKQTLAIESSSSANIRSADAQKIMADTTTKAQIPDIDLQELRITGVGNPPIEGDQSHVWVNLVWRFRNTGGSALITESVEFGLWSGSQLPNQIPRGFIISGQDAVITPTIDSAFGPLNPVNMKLETVKQSAILAGRENLYFFAIYKYRDRQGSLHQRCFGRQFVPDGNSTWSNSHPSGSAAYRCAS